jgi:hypothetical protein
LQLTSLRAPQSHHQVVDHQLDLASEFHTSASLGASETNVTKPRPKFSLNGEEIEFPFLTVRRLNQELDSVTATLRIFDKSAARKCRRNSGIFKGDITTASSLYEQAKRESDNLLQSIELKRRFWLTSRDEEWAQSKQLTTTLKVAPPPSAQLPLPSTVPHQPPPSPQQRGKAYTDFRVRCGSNIEGSFFFLAATNLICHSRFGKKAKLDKHIFCQRAAEEPQVKEPNYQAGDMEADKVASMQYENNMQGTWRATFAADRKLDTAAKDPDADGVNEELGEVRIYPHRGILPC